MIDTVGFSEWDTLPANTLLRLTLADNALITVPGNWPGSFLTAVKDLYGQLYPRASMIPTTPLALQNDARATVVDAMLKTETPGNILVQRLSSISGRFAEVTKVERLAGKARTDATAAAGAETRYLETQKAIQSVTDNAWTTAVAKALGVSVKVAFAIIVAVLLFVLWGKFR
jgi:hypothetical protein